MQPTQQQCIPVTFYTGYVTGDDTIVPLLEAYDHIITDINCVQYAGSSDDYLELDDQDGNYLWSTEMGFLDSEAVTVHWQGFIVLQDVTELQIVDQTINTAISISGWRLHPSASFIFSS